MVHARRKMIVGVVLAVFLGAVVREVVRLVVTRGGTHVARTPTGETPELSLPAPETSGGLTLTEALARRRSQREFADRPLTAQQVGQLCWAAQGVTNPTYGLRTAPSAGALYPVVLYVVDPTGVYEYLPDRHALRPLRAGDVRARLRGAAPDQDGVGQAPCCLVITIDPARTAAKYGGRAERYALLEAGHVAQNVLLQATALDLAGVPVGAFEDVPAAAALGLPANRNPVYLLPLGFPRGP